MQKLNVFFKNTTKTQKGLRILYARISPKVTRHKINYSFLKFVVNLTNHSEIMCFGNYQIFVNFPFFHFHL